MALAAFGSPSFLPQFRDIVRAKGDGRYTIERGDLARRFGPARERGAPLEQRHYDLAASLQKSLEETVIALGRWLREASGDRRLAMAGGVALNCNDELALARQRPLRLSVGSAGRGRCRHSARRGALD